MALTVSDSPGRDRHRSRVLLYVMSFVWFIFQHIFQLELEEYRLEGVNVNEIVYADNQPLLVSVQAFLASNVFVNLDTVEA